MGSHLIWSIHSLYSSVLLLQFADAEILDDVKYSCPMLQAQNAWRYKFYYLINTLKNEGGNVAQSDLWRITIAKRNEFSFKKRTG
jgi:hypothetical protein